VKNEFTTFDIINGLEIPRGRLREWMNEGFLVPSIQKAEGVGTKALFDRVDIYTLLVFKHLIEQHRMARSEAAEIVKGWGIVMRVFKEGIGEKEFDDFISTYDTFRVLRFEKKLVVMEVVIGDILVIHLHHPQIRARFMDAIGEPYLENALAVARKMNKILGWDALKSKGKALQQQFGPDFMKRQIEKRMTLNPGYEDWDSILMINFRKIREEAERMF
jgi:hypothetical protein